MREWEGSKLNGEVVGSRDKEGGGCMCKQAGKGGEQCKMWCVITVSVGMKGNRGDGGEPGDL